MPRTLPAKVSTAWKRRGSRWPMFSHELSYQLFCHVCWPRLIYEIWADPCAEKDHETFTNAKSNFQSPKNIWTFKNRIPEREDRVPNVKVKKFLICCSTFLAKNLENPLIFMTSGENFNLMYLREYLSDWADFWRVGSGKFFSFDFLQQFLASGSFHFGASGATIYH